VVRTGQHTILIETGIGNKLPEMGQDLRTARQCSHLAAADVSPEDIDIVINTPPALRSLRLEHNTPSDKVVPTFPKAKYYAPEGEWQHGRLQLERDAIQLHVRQL